MSGIIGLIGGCTGGPTGGPTGRIGSGNPPTTNSNTMFIIHMRLY